MDARLRETLLPHKIETALYVIVATFISFAGNFAFFAERLADDSAYVAKNFNEANDLYQQQFVSFFDTLSFAPATAVFVFWSLAGIFAYSIFQSVLNVVQEVRADVDINSHYLHPKHYATKQFVVDTFRHSMVNTLLYTIGVLAALLVGFVFSPVAIKSLEGLLVSFSFPLFLIYIGAVLLLALTILIVATCIRLILLKKQILL